MRHAGRLRQGLLGSSPENAAHLAPFGLRFGKPKLIGTLASDDDEIDPVRKQIGPVPKALAAYAFDAISGDGVPEPSGDDDSEASAAFRRLGAKILKILRLSLRLRIARDLTPGRRWRLGAREQRRLHRHQEQVMARRHAAGRALHAHEIGTPAKAPFTSEPELRHAAQARVSAFSPPRANAHT
jgi:hypothetical protein